MKRIQLQKLIRLLMRNLTRTTFEGAQYIPASGPLIIATNHLSRIDIPVLFINPVRPDLTALVTTKYKAYPLIKWFVHSAEGVWLDRETADFTAFRTAADKLKQGVAMGISPEGTRSKDGGLLPGKPGTVLLALKSNAPIVPVGLVGTETATYKLKHFKRPEIHARFGPAFSIPELSREHREAELKYWTDEIMCRIAVLLPPAYRGVYTDHPRVKALLNENIAGYTFE
jgi:1-acyl-sn-glycerol-3-phosphate acyltransferase